MKDSNNNNLEAHNVYDITYKYLGKAQVTHRAMFCEAHQFSCRITSNLTERPKGFSVPQYWENYKTGSGKIWYTPRTHYSLPYVPLDKVTEIVKVDTKKALIHDNIAPEI